MNEKINPGIPQKPVAPIHKESNSRDKLYITLIILLLVGGGIITWQFMDKSNNLDKAYSDIDTLNYKFDEMVEILGGKVTKDELKTELQGMLSQISTLQIDNTTYQDSLSSNKQQIEILMAQVEKYKGDAKMAYKYKKEIGTLKGIMQHYVHIIDSLNTLNTDLTNELDYTSKKLTSIQGERDKLEKHNNELSNTVKQGSILNAINMLSEAVKVKSNGEAKITSRASRAEQIRVCFTLAENKIAKPGQKNIYMRILDPGGKVISDGVVEEHTIESNGESIVFSVMREMNYQNEPVDMCIYYELKDVIPAGDYIIELYAEGAKIGSTILKLK